MDSDNLSADLFDSQTSADGVELPSSLELEPNSADDSSTSSVLVHLPNQKNRPRSSSSSVKSQKIPNIVQACFKSFTTTASCRSAVCTECGTRVRDGPTGTSNWCRHINREGHRASRTKYEQFLSKNSQASSSSTRSVTEYFSPSSKWKSTDPKNIAIKSSIISMLIKCSLPLSLVERASFRELITKCEARFSHIDRRTVSKEIDSRYKVRKQVVLAQLSSASDISMTVDIWTDRTMRAYLGVTAHYIHDSTLKSALICCQRFTGSHTGVNIRDTFEALLLEYDLASKVRYIISDNASNMRKAFETRVNVDIESLADVDEVDNIELWEDLDMAIPDVVGPVSPDAKHLRCFAHSLQLAIRDGRKQLRGMYGALGKCSKMATLLHSSTKFKEVFEMVFGNNIGIPQPNDTRWNSMYLHVSKIVNLGLQQMNVVLEETSNDNLKLTMREHHCLEELVAILKPFYEVTQKTQGDKEVTVSYVLPSILMLLQSLKDLRTQYLTEFSNKLEDAIKTRFSALLLLVDPIMPMQPQEPFGDPIYILSTVLDPNWGPSLIDFCVDAIDGLAVKDKIRDLLMDELMEIQVDRDTMEPSQTQSQPPSDSVFAAFFQQRAGYQSNTTITAQQEVAKLWSMASKKCDPIAYWRGEKILIGLKQLALKYLSVPATSAPVERVFSSSGFIMRPRRSSMHPDMVAKLVFLKCNT